jgi:uncharacterized glyoxalase superfamily protein PhnB
VNVGLNRADVLPSARRLRTIQACLSRRPPGGAVELQLGTVPTGRTVLPTTVDLFVNDADALAVEWREAGVDVRSPEDTPWGKREGVIVDPDGSIIRFGSRFDPM